MAEPESANAIDLVQAANRMISERRAPMTAENLNRAMLALLHGEPTTDFDSMVEQRGNPTAQAPRRQANRAVPGDPQTPTPRNTDPQQTPPNAGKMTGPGAANPGGQESRSERTSSRSTLPVEDYIETTMAGDPTGTTAPVARSTRVPTGPAYADINPMGDATGAPSVELPRTVSPAQPRQSDPNRGTATASEPGTDTDTGTPDASRVYDYPRQRPHMPTGAEMVEHPMARGLTNFLIGATRAPVGVQRPFYGWEVPGYTNLPRSPAPPQLEAPLPTARPMYPPEGPTVTRLPDQIPGGGGGAIPLPGARAPTMIEPPASVQSVTGPAAVPRISGPPAPSGAIPLQAGNQARRMPGDGPVQRARQESIELGQELKRRAAAGRGRRNAPSVGDTTR